MDIKYLEKQLKYFSSKLKDLKKEKLELIINKEYTEALLEYNKRLFKSSKEDICILTATRHYIPSSGGLPSIISTNYTFGLIDGANPIELKKLDIENVECHDMVFVNTVKAGYASQLDKDEIIFNDPRSTQEALNKTGIVVSGMTYGKNTETEEAELYYGNGTISSYKFTDMRGVLKTITGDGRGKIRDIEERLFG